METSKPRKAAKQFRNKFARAIKPLSKDNLEPPAPPQGRAALEATPEEPSSDFLESEIPDRLGYSKESLYKMIETYLDNDPNLKEIADKILRDAPDHMRAVANDDDDHLRNFPEAGAVLEVIVETDGSRPSFMIRDGVVDVDSSPIGDWQPAIDGGGASLKTAIECTGRINIGQKHVGTGFLIARNLIITNRHVLQSIGRQDANGAWTLHPNANIDFGHEFKARESVNRRKLKSLVYTGPSFIDRNALDHSKLDLAMIELADAADENVPKEFFSWNAGMGWTWPPSDIFIIGYPGDPGLMGVANYGETLLDQLFKSTYGCKRLAPGKVMERSMDDLEWTLSHDATTLGGNSGSVIVPRSAELRASALHYGGDLAEPRENWGHILGLVTTVRDAGNKTLQEFLESNNVVIGTDD